jgi:hypothetical protein
MLTDARVTRPYDSEAFRCAAQLAPDLCDRHVERKPTEHSPKPWVERRVTAHETIVAVDVSRD